MYKKVTHIGEGKFECIMEDNSIKEAGPNICGIIRYTYFENYSFPVVGWSVTREKLIEDHAMKVSKAINEGKIYFDTTLDRWIEIN